MKDARSKLSLIYHILKSHDLRLFQAIQDWSGAVAIWMQFTGAPTDIQEVSPKDVIMEDMFYISDFECKKK